MGSCASVPAEQPSLQTRADNNNQLSVAPAEIARMAPLSADAQSQDQSSGAPEAVSSAAQNAQESPSHRCRSLSGSGTLGHVSYKEEMRRTQQRLMNATSEEIAQIIDVDVDPSVAHRVEQPLASPPGSVHSAPDLAGSVGRRTEDRMGGSCSHSRSSHRTEHRGADRRIHVEFTGFARHR